MSFDPALKPAQKLLEDIACRLAAYFLYFLGDKVLLDKVAAGCSNLWAKRNHKATTRLKAAM
jgi:hypothetical protein